MHQFLFSRLTKLNLYDLYHSQTPLKNFKEGGNYRKQLWCTSTAFPRTRNIVH